MAWDVTVPDTFAESHLSSTSVEQGAAAKQEADNKTMKYQELETTHIFFPGCYRDSRLVGSSSHRTGAGDWETHRQYHCGQQRNHVLVSEAVHDSFLGTFPFD